MAFYNYILLAILVLLLGFLVVSSKKKMKKKGWLKRTVNVVTITAIIFITSAVVLFPDLRSVKTTGEDSYSSCTLELTDSTRIEDYKSDGSYRKLSVLVYYPDSGSIESNSCPLLESDNKYVQNKNYLYNNGNVEYYYIKGSNHYTLTDLVRKSPILCALLGGGYKKFGYDTLVFINQKSLAFFDKHLSG